MTFDLNLLKHFASIITSVQKNIDKKTRMTTSISSEALKNRGWECVQVDLDCIFKNQE